MSPSLAITGLAALAFTLATVLQPRQQAWKGEQAASGSMLKLVLGDARTMFSYHYLVKADTYFHNGYYPSIFDQASRTNTAKPHVAHREGEPEDHDEEKEDVLGKPKDFLDGFGRNFFVSTHAHMDKPGETRELLPWLKLSAELDPHRVETYTITAYWLASQMHKPDEAIEFLREGWRANPDSTAILLELGRVYQSYRNDPVRARNLWEAALRKWDQAAAKKHWFPGDPEMEGLDPFVFEQLLGHLADLEEKEGRFADELIYLKRLEQVSPAPDAIRKRIQETQEQLSKPGKPPA